jgi:hypothetical protein
MAPYVPLLLPELQKALFDPLPDVRATAARAMGALLRGMGPEESGLSQLLPWLLAALRSEGSSVERSGAAQGLAEVLAVLGEGQLAQLLPTLVDAARAARSPFVREGHLTLLRYLPATMEAAFRAHLGEALPLVLEGLSDEAEGVRDAALAAGRAFVDHYARPCLPLLLPAVEAGLAAPNWRIRQASVELCGELLFRVAGTSGKVRLDGGSDDEGPATEEHAAAVLQALGRARRDEVLSRLYVARADAQYGVRSAALHVWKTLVTNTPRTLHELLPALSAELVQGLAGASSAAAAAAAGGGGDETGDGAGGASPVAAAPTAGAPLSAAAAAEASEERRAACARALGELVRKMGDRVLGRLLPILRAAADDPHATAATRQGVVLGLGEVVECATRTQLAEHLNEILPPIQKALCDPDARVREAAGAAFGVLFRSGGAPAGGAGHGGHHGHGQGGGAGDAVVPALLSGMLDADATEDHRSQSLEGLRVILSVKPGLFHGVLPKLLKAHQPHVAPALSALAELAEVAGELFFFCCFVCFSRTYARALSRFFVRVFIPRPRDRQLPFFVCV